MKNFIKNNLHFIIFFISFFLIGFFIPYSHDDWFWGSNWGIEAFKNGFDNVNGRYVGNLLALILTRSRLLRALFIAIILLAVVILISKICKKNKLAPYITIILLFTLSVYVLKQTVTWTAGFVNYVVPVVGILYFLYLNGLNDKPHFKKYTYLFMLPLGIINCLFMENLTLFNVLLALYFVVYPICKKEKPFKCNVLYLIGAIIGCIIMFTNKVYFQIAGGGDIYGNRSFDNTLYTFFEKFVSIISKNLVFDNIFIILLVSICLLSIIKKAKEKKWLKNILTFVIFGYTSYAIIFNFIDMEYLFLNYTNIFNAFLTFIYIIAVFITTIFIIKDNKTLLFLLICIVVMVAPLFVVNPIQSRCMFPPYILLIIYSLILMEKTNINFEKIKNEIKLFALFIIFTMLYIYGYVYIVDSNRIKHIEKNIDKKEIEIINLPHRRYVLNPEPVNDDYMPHFKYFYNINEKTEVKIYNHFK